jgi:hypothetical protein
MEHANNAGGGPNKAKKMIPGTNAEDHLFAETASGGSPAGD